MEYFDVYCIEYFDVYCIEYFDVHCIEYFDVYCMEYFDVHCMEYFDVYCMEYFDVYCMEYFDVYPMWLLTVNTDVFILLLLFCFELPKNLLLVQPSAHKPGIFFILERNNNFKQRKYTGW